ncbi:transposon Tf2-6 polyprotein [Trichonephila clavipes]|nr:transposon Tf2-6 polyprotein [Trichonephila clavipes]
MTVGNLTEDLSLIESSRTNEIHNKEMIMNEQVGNFNPPTGQHGFFCPTREASKTDHTEFSEGILKSHSLSSLLNYLRAFGDGPVAGVPGGQVSNHGWHVSSSSPVPQKTRRPDGHELVSSVRALVPQKFSVEEELMHVKPVEVKSPHVGVMWKFGRGIISTQEIGEQATSKETIIELETKLEKSAAFKDDPDFVINLLNLSVEDRLAKAERQLQETNSQLELEKIKLQQIELEIELQKTLAEGQATQQERSFRVKNVPENLKAEILINILGERAHNVLLYIKDDEIKEYDLVKSLILREFQPTAQECLLNFRKAKRQADETHVQFATRLSAMFKYYLKIRNVVDFKSLVDLMISDKFLDTLEPETASYIKTMQADQWMAPDELGKACDIFFISKNRSLRDSRDPNTVKSKNDDVYSKNRANMGYTNQFQRQFPKHNQSVRADKTVSCYICGGPHFARNCTKKTMNSEKRHKDTGHAVNQIETSISNQNNFLFKELQYVDVIVDDTPLRATLDSGANSVIINSNGIRDKVQTLIENYSPNKTDTTALKMKIILSDEKPIAQRSRRLSLPEKREVEKQIDEWLEQGIIRENFSDFSSPVVVCKKKDGTM